ncbi:hypothetical protein NPIL_227901 [Nephila pilipes]|uniref:Uncharacterized protein n=1 Tax=Nephila pilipes TaxID=299642 RepID=A0A8X6M868_NEPPI|nr:hypothetical protein NPIL_227901 [Nephila pilipes]
MNISIHQPSYKGNGSLGRKPEKLDTIFEINTKNRNKSYFLKIIRELQILESSFMHPIETSAEKKFLGAKFKYFLKNSLSGNFINDSDQCYKISKHGRKRNARKGKTRPEKDCPIRVTKRKKSQNPSNTSTTYQRRRSTRRQTRPSLRVRRIVKRRRSKKAKERRRKKAI